MLKNGLKVGDTVYIKGHTTDFKEPVTSIQLEHETIQEGKKGQEIGYITDEFGNEVQKINAAAEGIILYKIGTPPVNKGETLFCIGSR